MSGSGAVKLVMCSCTACIPVIMQVRVGVDTGHAYALVMITPISDSRFMFGVSNRRFSGYTRSPYATELSAQL